MKKYFIIILLCLVFNCLAHAKVSVSISKAGTVIEVSENSSTIQQSYSIQAYRLGPTSANVLKTGLQTALKWADLNLTHKKYFEKEISRFKAMDYELFKHMGYIDQAALEMKILFKGYHNGSFEVVIGKYNSRDRFLYFSDKASIRKFIDLLNGKSANKEIDNIFKK